MQVTIAGFAALAQTGGRRSMAQARLIEEMEDKIKRREDHKTQIRELAWRISTWDAASRDFDLRRCKGVDTLTIFI